MPYDIVGDDFVGTDEFVGADGYDEVDQILSGLEIVGAHRGTRGGARPAARRGGARSSTQNANLNAALAHKRAQSGLMFDQLKPGAARRLVLGMASTGQVAPGSIAQITARPQNLAFKPQRIVIPATLAPDFLITDIKVGNVSQMVQSGTLPAEAFTQGLFDGMMEMDTVQTSQDFVLQVQNIAGAARNFNAAVYGLALLAR
jgi:hypothetical protein